MGYFARKTLVGGFKQVEDEIIDHPDVYIQTMDEYRSTREEISSLKKDIGLTKDAAKKYKEKADTEAQKEIQKNKTQCEEKVLQAQQQIRAFEEEIQALKDEIENLKNLNVNLIRVATERANQQRGLTPKKLYDGYIVLKTEQWKEKWVQEAEESGKKGKQYMEAPVWRSIIQTPFAASIPLDNIRSEISSDLLNKVLRDIEIHRVINGVYNGTYVEINNENTLYKWKYIADFKSDLWQLEIFTTKPITVPEYRRPPKKSQKK